MTGLRNLRLIQVPHTVQRLVALLACLISFGGCAVVSGSSGRNAAPSSVSATHTPAIQATSTISADKAPAANMSADQTLRGLHIHSTGFACTQQGRIDLLLGLDNNTVLAHNQLTYSAGDIQDMST
ncbi:MAG: hypothetical protein ACRDID_04395, partial [Ktedonobacterales bacterium]